MAMQQFLQQYMHLSLQKRALSDLSSRSILLGRFAKLDMSALSGCDLGEAGSPHAHSAHSRLDIEA